MFSVPCRKPVIVAFLAVQAVAAQCMPCVCEQEETGELLYYVHATDNLTAGDANSRCFICQNISEARQSQRFRPNYRLTQAPAVAEPSVFTLGDTATIRGEANFSSDDLASATLCLLSVFLE